MNANPSRFTLRSLTSPLALLRKWLFSAMALVSFAVIAPQAAAQTTVELTSVADSEIYGDATATNYGACNEMYVGFFADAKKNFTDRALVRFDLSTLPANITIQSATLRLTSIPKSTGDTTPETTSRNVSIHQIEASQVWTEGTGACNTGTTGNVTWANRTTGTPWSTAGGGTLGTALATTSVGGLGQHTWTSTTLRDAASSWYSTPSNNNGLIVKYTSETTNGYKLFASRQASTDANRPKLIITYTLSCTGSTGGATTVCPGSTANVTPDTGGTWSSNNTGVATVTNAGVVTGVSAGTATLTFTETSTGCQYTRTMTVNSPPVLGGGAGGVGTNTVNTEYWNSAPAGDTVDNIPTTGADGSGTAPNFGTGVVNIPYSQRFTGFINITTAGSYTFYTDSDDGSKLFINGSLVVNNDGGHAPQEISGTVSLTPGWYPITVAYFNGAGSGSLAVLYQGPSIAKQWIPSSVLSATLPSSGLTLCAGATANLTPSTGGIWASSNNSVATVTNGGVVTGVAAGSATLTFTDTTTGCSNTISTTITPGPTLGGETEICINSDASVSPSSGGTWTSSNNAIATVTNSGTVRGVSPGTVTLTFTNTTTGCISTKSFTVLAPPTLGGASVTCPGQTATVSPTTGGTWASSNNGIATVTNAGVVTGVSVGTVTLTFTDTTTGCFNSRSFTVNAQVALGGASSTCVGTAALVTPNVGGTWASSNNAVATVTNGGVVTGVSGGSVTLSFTNATTGCVSTKAFVVNVPLGGGGGAGIGGATAVCAGFQANVTPDTGGVWSTSDSAIATVTNAGVVTGFSAGTVVLTYTENATGCVSTVDFNVYPNVTAGGANSVCQGAIANVTPTTNGTWVSSDPAIAYVTNSGFVTGLQPGTVTLTFTSLGGCTTSKSFTVKPKPVALGAASVQVGQTANVTPATGGTWTSSNPAVATITNAGLVSGLTEGAVTLTFTDTLTGCSGTKSLNVTDPGLYKNESFTDSGNKVDPNPLNNEEPEIVYPQSFTALVVTVFQDLDGDTDGDQPVNLVTITVRDSQGTVVAVVTTGVDGSYTFTDLPPGFYTVTQTVPNGNFTYNTNPEPVSVVENDTVRVDFVNSQLGQITGTILADAGDEAMPNVLVSLLDENGDPVLDSSNQPITTTTNSSGFYLFDRVPPGTYQVQQTVPSGYTSVDDVDGSDLTINGDITPIVIAPGTIITNQDFVNFLPGSITGNISIDTDINLTGDVPHVGVTVALFRPGFGPDGIANNADDNNALTTQLTDASGNFSFTNLTPGDYRVGQTVPSGYTAVADSDGGSFTVVGDVTVLAVAAGQNQTASFVNQPQTDIAVDKTVSNSTPVVGSNVTFTVTVTNNGPQNATDVKVDDVALGMLYVSHVASQGTFAISPGAPANTFSGLWTVGALNAGQSRTLTVVATVTPNAIVSAYNNYVKAYSELGDPNLTNNEYTVTLNPVLGTISGRVRRDIDGDNIGDMVPVQGVTLALVDQNGNPVLNASNVPLTTVTSVSGTYSFTGLPPGNYRVVETVPAGDVAVNDVDGGNKAIIGDVTLIALAAGQTVPDQNFVIAAVGSIAGTITNDTTGDSVGDSPLGGVVVVLLTSAGNPVLDGNGDPITTLTNGSGAYTFTNLTPGSYRVAHIPPGGMIAVDDVDGGNLTINGDITPILIIPGQNVTGQNFVDSLLGAVSGTVLADADDDGDGDTGIAGVTLALVNSSNVTIATTTTNSLGQYAFTNIPAGTYRVVETQPTGYDSVSDEDGGNLNINGDVSPVSLLPGGNVTNQDFVEILNATITGIVRADTNNDDIGDSPLAGVIVTLLDGSDNVVATTTTAVDGTYSFVNVVPGDYTVEETDPASYSSVTPNTVAVSLLPGGSAFVPFIDEQTIADLAITKVVNVPTPLVGAEVIFTITTTNNGPIAATGVSVTEALPSGYTFVSAIASVGSYSTVNGIWTVGGLANGNSASLTVTATVKGTGSYLNTVTVTGNEQDSNLSNNTDTESVTPFEDLDTDDDGIPDTIEIANVCPASNGDTDGDGVPDHLDLDSDGDGIFDVVEAGNGALDANKDGSIDSTQGNNGLADVVETSPDSDVINYSLPDRDSDGRPNYLDLDSDSDSISDLLESGNGAVIDSQNRGVAEGTVNTDGIVPGAGSVTPINTDLDLFPDYLDVDSDNDTVFDIVDNGYGSLDANGNGMIDNMASPADCDGIADVLDPKDNEYGWFPEMGCVAWLINNPDDTDADVFPANQEYVFGGSPLLGDHRVVGTTRRAGMAIEKNGTGGVDISYVRPAGRFDAVVIPYVTHDPRLPGTWTAVTAQPSITDNGDGTQTIKWANIHEIDANALVTSDRGFVRLHVATTCEPSGSWTLVQGWSRQSIVGKRQTYGRNFSSMPVFTGIVSSASGSVIATAASSNGANLGTFLAPGVSYYIEMTDGTSVGERFDIASGGVDTFNINLASTNNTLAALPLGLAGSHYVVRRHVTLGEIYPNAEWEANSSAGSADQVLFFSGSGYTTYFNFSTGVWVRQGSGFGSQNGLIVAPGTGMLVVHASPAKTNAILEIGDLRYNNFRRPLALGSTGLNFMALGYPFDSTPAQLSMTIPNGFIANAATGSASQILNWVGDTTPNTSGWTTNYLLPTDASGSWRTQGNLGNITTTSPLFRYNRSAHVDVQVGKANWFHPRPWDPAPWYQP
jgi:uncharacterized repeat protein (TIGR01451 family)